MAILAVIKLGIDICNIRLNGTHCLNKLVRDVCAFYHQVVIGNIKHATKHVQRIRAVCSSSTLNVDPVGTYKT